MNAPYNPILRAVAREAAALDWPISGITLVSPMVTAAPILSINWARMEEDAGKDDVKPGVSMTALSRVPETTVALPPMTDIETMVIQAAWQHGAWDVKRTAVSADYMGGLPPYTAAIHDRVSAEGYVAWYWRPMLRGPECRQMANGKRDNTLNAWSLGRDGEPPVVRTPRLAPNREMVIRLGVDPDRPRSKKPRRLATANQRGYLGRLLRDAGEDDTLPAGLTLQQASDWIDRLAPDRKRIRRATSNQIVMINSYAQRLGEPGTSGWGMSWDEAEKRINDLRSRL